jgi:hypothetical protein
MVYTDTIIPETQQMYDSICHQLGLDKDGIRIEACFDHLTVLQDDEQVKHQAEKIEAETSSIMINDVIKLNTAIVSGQMTRDTAINSLISLYECEPETAATLII